MSDTPRCDAAENTEAWRDPNQWVTELSVAWGLARTLERELAARPDVAKMERLIDWLDNFHPAMLEKFHESENLRAGDE